MTDYRATETKIAELRDKLGLPRDFAAVSVLDLLIGLREKAGLTQEHVAKKIFRTRRRTFGDWESGAHDAQPRYRDQFRVYLLDHLGLFSKINAFFDIWEYVAVEQWGWEPLSRSDVALLQRFQMQQKYVVRPPDIPPYLIAHELVGRDTIVTQLQEWLVSNDDCAIVGMPGVGKTALAVTLATNSAVRKNFEDGILWAGVGQNPDVSSILRDWAMSLGKDIAHITDLKLRIQVVRNTIGSRQMLLIIDDAWDDSVANQLRCGGPNCSHLLTTRVQSVAEQFVAKGRLQEIDELTPDLSYALLEQLAPDACHKYESLARQLAGQTGGLPLTIVLLGGYLSAPESRYFAATTESRLTDMFDPKQRLLLAQKRLGSNFDSTMSLHEMIALSLDSLPEPVASAYADFGAFAAKPAWFDVSAAKVIAQIELEAVGLLIDRHLLEIGKDELLTIHQVLAEFARTRMEANAITRHRDFYLDQAIQARDNWRQIQAIYEQIRRAWYQQLKKELDNEALLKFIYVLKQYQQRRGLWDECRDWCVAALPSALNEQKLAIAADLHSTIAKTHLHTGDRAQALEDYQHALKLRERTGDKLGYAVELLNIGDVFYAIGYFQDSLESYSNALNMIREEQNLKMEATVLSNIGRLHVDLDDMEEALDYLSQALAICEQLGDIEMKASVLMHIAAVNIELTEYKKALENLHDARELISGRGNLNLEAGIQHDVGTVMLRIGDYEQAKESYEHALFIREKAKDRPGEARAAFGLGSVYKQLGLVSDSPEQLYLALQYHYKALNLQMEVQDRQAQLHTLGFIGVLHEQVGNLEIALGCYEDCLQLASEFPNHRDEAALFQKIGEVSYKMGKLDKAEESLQTALDMVLESGTLIDQRAIFIDLALVYRNAGRTADAIEQMHRVRELDRYLNHPDMNTDQEFLDYLQSRLPG